MRVAQTVAAIIVAIPLLLNAQEKNPVLVGFDGEFGVPQSTSAQAIERGILIAIDEINDAGGVLGGRPLQLVSRDNRSVTARGIRNLKDFAQMADMTAMFVGRFSPVALDQLPLAHELNMIILDAWAAADGITNNGYSPNYAFRLSLKDSLAMPTMLQHALSKGAQRIGLLLPNTSWGRSNLAAAKHYYANHSTPESVATTWYQWGDRSMLEKYQSMRAAGAQTVIIVANESEAIILCKEVAALPPEQRMPIISHWGVTGGNFASRIGDNLKKIDFSVVQTFSFFRADPERVRKLMAISERLFGIKRIEDHPSPVGVGHAYDLTHILARAIDLAGTTDRAQIRAALERVRAYKGLTKDFEQPFSETNHDALQLGDVFMARFRASDGAIVPLSPGS